MTEVYHLQEPVTRKLPIVLSIPHVGTGFPEMVRPAYKPELLPPDDTDWFVDQLYNFASGMGIPVIAARYSRWVIDLNRHPENQLLYQDGRQQTGLCPVTNFRGQPVYADERSSVEETTTRERYLLYYEPYHRQVQVLLDEVKQQFGAVLLWDGHSIRRQVPTIAATPFPDLVLGSADGTTADPALINIALRTLRAGRYEVAHNHPFRGGHITRYFGKPHLRQHALQLEMCKDLYMDDVATRYEEQRAGLIQPLLQETLENIGKHLLQSI